MKLEEVLIIMYRKLNDKSNIKDPFLLYSIMSDYCNKDFVLKDLCRKYFDLNIKIDFVNIILNNKTETALDILHDKYKEVNSFITLDDYKACIKSTILMVDNKYSFLLKNDKTDSEGEKEITITKSIAGNFDIINKNIADKDFDIQNKVLVSYLGNSNVVKIPYGVKRLKYKCICNNHKVEKIIIPSSVLYIDYLVFENLPNLKEIYISKGVKFISDHAFGGCNFPIIKCQMNKQPVTWDRKWNYSYYGNFFKRRIKVLWNQK